MRSTILKTNGSLVENRMPKMVASFDAETQVE